MDIGINRFVHIYRVMLDESLNSEGGHPAGVGFSKFSRQFSDRLLGEQILRKYRESSEHLEYPKQK